MQSRQPKPYIQSNFGINLLISVVAICFLLLFLIVPLLIIFGEAFRGGIKIWWQSIIDEDALSAIKLTLIAALIAVPLNTIFGIAASWAIAKFKFYGRSILITLIDLPFAVSPVVSGLIYVLVFGVYGYIGAWFAKYDIQIIFAVPGIVLVTMFVSFPYVARELIPLMAEQGCDEEQAALTLGAGGWQCFRRVTLPNIKWGLMYGIILCNARAMGEFGAVSVVSGHIRGETNTLPLQVEILYNEYNLTAAFSVASLLACLGLLTLIAKSLTEWCSNKQMH